jgi:hypothetical protein
MPQRLLSVLGSATTDMIGFTPKLVSCAASIVVDLTKDAKRPDLSTSKIDDFLLYRSMASHCQKRFLFCPFFMSLLDTLDLIKTFGVGFMTPVIDELNISGCGYRT